MSLSVTSKQGTCLRVRGPDSRPCRWTIADIQTSGSQFVLRKGLQFSSPWKTSITPKQGAGARPIQPKCALVTAAEFRGSGGSEATFFQKLATVWNIFFPPPKKTLSARAMAKTRLVQTLAEEEFGLTRKQISVIGQQIGRVLEDYVELDATLGAEAPVLDSKLEARGRLKVMFKVRRVKPSAEDGWFGGEDNAEWSPYMADNVANTSNELEADAKKEQVDFDASLAMRGQADSLDWLDSDTLMLRQHEQDSD